MEGLELWIEDRPSNLRVRRFLTHEAMNEPFAADVWAVIEDPSLDLEAIAGHRASFVVVTGDKNGVPGRRRVLAGICRHAELVKAEPIGVSTYRFHIVAHLWLLTQRRGYRIFQHRTPREIVEQILGEWHLPSAWILRSTYRPLLYKVQYGETDHDFCRRILEEAGIAFAYVQDGDGMHLVFSDAFEQQAARGGPPIPYVDNPNQVAGSWFREFVTHVHVAHGVRPGKRTLRDYDFRRPDHALFGKAPDAPSPENKYEQYAYKPGGFLVETAGPGGSPQDDKATARHDDGEGQGDATRDLEAMRGQKIDVSFSSNVLDLWPSVLFYIGQHAHPDVPAGRKLLLLSFAVEGAPDEEWSMRGVAVPADVAHRPPVVTPRPRAKLQSAVVVGPQGQEIHTDEHGRVRVQFPWDREGKNDPDSTPWIRTSQGWAGKGFGMLNLPRVGQEVLVDFLEGDPEQPMIVGRVFNSARPLPYNQPELKTRNGWKSDSSPFGHGYNEIFFEDDKENETFSMQAEKNRRQLVKNDEFLTVGNDRNKVVEKNEIETTLQNRIEVTGIDRNETTGHNRMTVIGKDRKMFAGADETERTFANHELAVIGDQDVFVGGMVREIVKADIHTLVDGDRMEKVGGHWSMQVEEDQQIHVDGRYAQYAKEDFHMKAATNLVLEAGVDLTFRGPAGFVRITPGGVIIKGTLVKINSGGGAGSGAGAHPVDPLLPEGSDDREGATGEDNKEQAEVAD